MRINEVLASKASHEVVTVRPDATVRELVAMLAEHNIGALVVSTDGSSVDGIVSERDVVRRLARTRRSSTPPSPRSCRSRSSTCDADATVNELMALMTDHAHPARPRRQRRPADRHRQHRRRGQEPDERARVRARPARLLRARQPDLTDDLGLA